MFFCLLLLDSVLAALDVTILFLLVHDACASRNASDACKLM